MLVWKTDTINESVSSGNRKTFYFENEPVDGTPIQVRLVLFMGTNTTEKVQIFTAGVQRIIVYRETSGGRDWYAQLSYSTNNGNAVTVINDDSVEPCDSVKLISIKYVTEEEVEPVSGNDDSWTRLEDVTPETGGIFTSLQEFAVPWQADNIAAYLDMLYYGNISGSKIISPLVDKKLSGGVLPAAKQRECALILFNVYGEYWGRQWDTLSEEYDPIANYDMEEVLTDDETVIEYGKTEDTTTGNTHTKTGTETDSPAVTVTTNDSVHGFNSEAVNGVPTDRSQETSSGTNETEYNTTDTDNGSIGLEQGGSDTHTRNYTLTRKGNIGVTTSQQLLQSERDLWKWNFFNDVVFPDVDRVLTIQTY